MLSILCVNYPTRVVFLVSRTRVVCKHQSGSIRSRRALSPPYFTTEPVLKPHFIIAHSHTCIVTGGLVISQCLINIFQSFFIKSHFSRHHENTGSSQWGTPPPLSLLPDLLLVDWQYCGGNIVSLFTSLLLTTFAMCLALNIKCTYFRHFTYRIIMVFVLFD